MSGSRRRRPNGKKASRNRERQQAKSRSKRYRCLRIAWQSTLIAASLAPIVYSVLAEWPVGRIAEFLLAGVAAALLSFHCVNTRTRIRLKHWGVKRLRRNLRYELASGWGMPIVVILAVLFLPPTWEKLAGIGVVFFLAWYGYEAIQEKIRSVVAEEGLRQGLDRFRERQPFRLLDVDADVDEIAEGEHGLGPQSFYVFWIKPSWRPGLSRARIVIINAMAISIVVSVVAAAHVAVQEAIRSRAGTSKRADNKSSPKPPADQADEGSDPAGGSEITPSGDATGSCPFLPAYGAPRWAGDILNALYFGGRALNANPAPGNDIGGCTGKAIVIPTEAGALVYTIGRNGLGETRSVAVVSRLFGPAIFLAPAAQRVLDLIERGHAPLGGYPTEDAAGGDVTAVTTEEGTFVFVRDEKHVPGQPKVAEPYIELPPTVASAWMGAMHETDSWLWPLAPRSWEGVTSFPLAADSAAEEGEFTVTYERGSGAARRDQYDYGLPAHPVSQAELRNAAALAR